MAISSAGALFFESNDYCREILREAEARVRWKAVSISKEGREPELRQLRELYDTLKDVHERSNYADLEFMQRAAVLVTADVFQRTGAPTDNDRIIDFVGDSAVHLLTREIFFGFATIDWDVPLDLEDTVALRNYLERKRHFLLYAPDIVEQWCERFIDIWVALFKHLPDRMFRAEDDRRGSFDLSTTVIDILDQPAVAIDDLIMAITQHGGKEHGLFEPLDAIIRDNVFIATGIREEDRATSKKPLLFPSKSREPLPRLPEIYLADTPFLDVFSAPVPVDVPDQTRFEHTHVIAGTGHGKTQLIQHLIAQDLDQVAQGEASVVVLDSQGDLIDNISHLDVFARGGPLADRLVLIDPTDVAFPVALNMFDMNTDAPDPLEQEKLLNGVLELYDYIFGSLLGAELTQKQDVIFRYVARLLLLIPGASIQHLLRLMEDGGLEDFAGYIGKLDSPTARAFFETEFNNKDFNATKQQVRRRLWGILENKTFEHMFSSPHSKLRLSDEMNAGKVILINTSKALLKQTGTEIFGRFFVALITQAALERASVPKSERVPTHVYIDEANDYFKGGDQNLPIILEQARKYRISMTLSHQFLDQLDAKLKASFAANTSIKIVGGVSDKDARAMASEMRTTAETIAAMRKFDDHSEFAISVKNVTAGAMRLRVPFGHMEGMPHMTEAQFSAVRDVQREQYCVPVAEIKETLTRQRSGGSFAHTPSDGADADPFGDSYD